jgi:hypothetical protein
MVSPITCLCDALRNLQESNQDIGTIPDTVNKKIARIRSSSTLECSPGATKMLTTSRILDLHALLSSPTGFATRDQEFGHLSRKQRLSLAVSLTSAVLQLYDTPWLDEFWTVDDIRFFFKGIDGNQNPSISNPYVSRSFSTRSSLGQQLPRSRATDTLLSPFVINKTLFALGIVLIELCLNQPFDSLRTSQPEVLNQASNILDDYQIALGAISKVYQEGGDQYGYVVQRCLKCEFQGQDSMKKLSVPRFKGFVYEYILRPLKTDYEQFSLYTI